MERNNTKARTFALFVITFLLLFLANILESPEIAYIYPIFLLYFFSNKDRSWRISSYLLRIMFGAFTLFYVPHTFESDAKYYLDLGIKTRQLLLTNPSAINLDDSSLWHFLSKFIYSIWGTNFHPTLAFNSFLGVVSAVFLEKIFFKLATPNQQNQMWGRIFFYFAPPWLYLFTNSLKEPVIFFLLTMYMYFTLSTKKITTFFSLVVLLLLSWARYLLGLIVGVTYFVKVISFIPFKSKTNRTLSVLILNIIFVSSIIIFVKPEVIKSRVLGHLSISSAIIENRANLSAKFLDHQNPYSIKNFAVVCFRSLVSPHPFSFLRGSGEWQKEEFIKGFFLLAPYFFLLPFFFMPFKKDKIYKGIYIPALIVFFGSFFMGSLTELTNYPETFRYRLPGFPMMLTIGLVNFLDFKNTPKSIRPRWPYLYFFIFGLFILSYSIYVIKFE